MFHVNSDASYVRVRALVALSASWVFACFIPMTMKLPFILLDGSPFCLATLLPFKHSVPSALLSPLLEEYNRGASRQRYEKCFALSNLPAILKQKLGEYVRSPWRNGEATIPETSMPCTLVHSLLVSIG